MIKMKFGKYKDKKWHGFPDFYSSRQVNTLTDRDPYHICTYVHTSNLPLLIRYTSYCIRVDKSLKRQTSSLAISLTPEKEYDSYRVRTPPNLLLKNCQTFSF